MKAKLFTLVLLSAFWLNAVAQTDTQLQTRQITMEIDAVDAMLPQINMLVKKGEKGQAKEMIEKALQQIGKIEIRVKQLGQLDVEDDDMPSISQIQETKIYLTNKLNQLRYTNIYISCNAQLFGSEYPALKDEILSVLSDNNVSFVESPDASDWTVNIVAVAREFSKTEFGGMSSYFSYVDAKTVIVKTATGKRIQEKSISEKGGSPFGYEQAAQEAYRQIAPRISGIIREQTAK